MPIDRHHLTLSPGEHEVSDVSIAMDNGQMLTGGKSVVPSITPSLEVEGASMDESYLYPR